MKSSSDPECPAGRRRVRQATAALRLVSFVWLSLATGRLWAGCDLKQMEIPVRIVDHRPIATLTLNGTEVPMLVDSGAFFSMLSEATASQLNLPLLRLPAGVRIEGYTGRIEARRTRVDRMGLRSAELRNVEFIVGGNELGAGIMGILGRNILAMADTEYDLAHGTVRLSFPQGACDETNFAYWAGEAPVVVVPLDRRQPRADTAIRVDVGINGKHTVALMDTGATQTALTLKAAKRAGIAESELKPRGRVGGAGEGRVTSWTGPVALFELGGEKIANNRLQIDDNDVTDEGMLLGLDYFLSHRIYVSRLQRQVYVTWNGGPVFALDRPEPGSYDNRDAALPQDIGKDNADALARRGAAALAVGNHERALEDLNRACELAPDVADYFYTRARLQLAMRQPRAALADLNEALRLDPTASQARFRRAALRAELGEREGAQADLAQLDAELPPSAALRAGMAHLHVGANQVAEALRQYGLWVSHHPKDAALADVLNARCWLRTRLNIDLPLALEDCEQAVDKDEGAAAHHDSLAWTHLRLGDAARAKKVFDAAIKLEPRPFSLYGRALAALRLNDRASAERDLAAARRQRPLIDEDVRKQGFEFAEALLRSMPALP